jgi:gliding motility-associated-like protein
MVEKLHLKYINIFLLGMLFFTSKNTNAQTAAFSPNVSSGCAPLTVTFTDQSTPGSTTWKWNFGNGNSTVNPDNRSVTAIYTVSGIYTVNLTLSNQSTVSHTITVFKNPVANFSVSPTTGCAGQTITLSSTTITGSGAIKEYIWKYGDGTSLTGAAATTTHVYGVNIYPVGLIVTDVNQCNSDTSKNITVVKAPVASFTTTPNTPAQCFPPLDVQFNNTSTITGPATYSWDFGDGSPVVTGASPKHTYSIKGVFSPSLTVSQGACSDVSTHTNSIRVQNISVDFTVKPAACVNENILFTGNVQPAASNQIWNFGDQSGSAIANPSHSYSLPGTYQVSLFAAAGTCADSVKKSIVINKTAANFKYSFAACSPFKINFADSSLNASTYLWDFGDTTATTTSTLIAPSHTYRFAGNHTVKLKVTSSMGCVDDVISKVINIQYQKTKFSTNVNRGCIPLVVKYTCTNTPLSNYKTFVWHFGDGATATGATTTHTITAVGVYYDTLFTTSLSNCLDTAIRIMYAGTKPMAKFSVAKDTVCYHKIVTFTDLSTGGANSWLYLYKDGQRDSLLVGNTKHIYADTGVFKTQLVALNNGCPDTSLITRITILPPKAIFNVTLNCTYTALFENQAVKADSIVWFFGDGIVDASNTKKTFLSHTYASRGLKEIKLKTFNYKTGCSDSSIQQITITDPKAKFTKSASSGCYPLIVKFVSSNSQDAVSFKWAYGNGRNSSSQDLIDTILTPQKYKVKLTITDLNGCQSSAIDSVIVYGPIPNFTADKLTGCAPLQVAFSDSSSSDSTKVKWLYDFGDGNKDSSLTSSISHNFIKPGFYTVKLTLTDKKGCAKSAQRVNYIQPTFPIPSFVADTFSCKGVVINFNAASTSAVNPLYTWNFGDGGLDTNTLIASIPHSYKADNLYSVKLTVKDKNGCTDFVKHKVLILKPKADFSSDSIIKSLCGKENIQFIDKSTGLVNNWLWDFGDGVTDTKQNPTNFYINPGKYSVSLIVKNAGGCADTSLKKDIVLVPGPIGSFTFDPATGCIPFHAFFKAVSDNSDSYSWDFGDGNVVNTLLKTTDHIYTKNIVVTPILLLTNKLPNGQPCSLPAKNLTGSISSQQQVKVQITPNVVTLTENEIYFFNTLVSNNKGKAIFHWQPTTGLTCTSCQRPGVKITSSTNYALLVTDSLGCEGRDTIFLNYLPCLDNLKIADVITPNGDGLNDDFKIQGACYKNDYSLAIYNRWGELVFASNEYTEAWDGRTKAGIMVDDGIYYYLLKRGGIDTKGFISVLRP